MGQETSHASTIMNTVGRYADRFITSPLNFEVSTVKASGEIEAGPYLLAKGGIWLINDWSCLSTKAATKLLREIENKQIVIEKVQQTVPLECSIWTIWSCSSKIKKDIASINQFMEWVLIAILPVSF